MNHTGKRKLVRGRATVAALENAGYEMNEIDIVDGTVFAGQLIVDPLSAGGQRFIEDFYDDKLGGSPAWRRETPVAHSPTRYFRHS